MMEDLRENMEFNQTGYKYDLSDDRSVYACLGTDGDSVGFIFTNKGVETRIGLSFDGFEAAIALYDKLRNMKRKDKLITGIWKLILDENNSKAEEMQNLPS